MVEELSGHSKVAASPAEAPREGEERGGNLPIPIQLPELGELYATSAACLTHSGRCRAKGSARAPAILDYSGTPRDQREVTGRFNIRTRYHG